MIDMRGGVSLFLYCCPSKIGNLATQHIFALKPAKALDSQVQKHSTSLFKHKTALTIELFEDLLTLELKIQKPSPIFLKCR